MDQKLLDHVEAVRLRMAEYYPLLRRSVHEIEKPVHSENGHVVRFDKEVAFR